MSTNGLDTIVAGVRCRDVLADLSEYLDGALPGARVAQLQAHLAGCENCARFGGYVAGALAALQREPAGTDEALTASVLARIRAQG